MKWRSWMILAIFLVSGCGTFAQNAVPAPQRARALVMGLGFSFFLDYLTRELINAIEKPEEKTLTSISVRTSMKEIKKVLTKNWHDQLTDWFVVNLQNEGLSDVAATEVGGFFKDGLQLPYYIKLYRLLTVVGQLSGDMLAIVFDLIKELGLGTVDAVKASMDQIFGSVGLVYSDLAYPIKMYHGTMLDCGYNDPYCLNQEAQFESDMLGDPERVIEDMIIMLEHGATISVGVLMAAIAYYTGSYLIKNSLKMVFAQTGTLAPHVVSEWVLGHVDTKAFKKVIQHILIKYANYNVINILGDWLVDMIEEYGAHEKIDVPVLTHKQLEKGLTKGYKWVRFDKQTRKLTLSKFEKARERSLDLFKEIFNIAA